MSAVRIWNGSQWILPSGFNRPKVWNGSTWVISKFKAWNGSNWNNVYSVPQSRTVTVGNFYYAGNKYTLGFDSWGYAAGGGYGSISPSDLFLWEGASVSQVEYGSTYQVLTFAVFSGDALITNSLWTSLTVNGYTFSRTSATYTSDISGGYSTGTWTWSTATNPFPTSVGATVTATWS